MSDNITSGERRELRSVVRGQFKVLRAQVKRREQELKAEIEAELLEKYREQDRAIAEAQAEVDKIRQDAEREVAKVAKRLREAHPDLTAGRHAYDRLALQAINHNRTQIHRALMASIPDKIGDANLALDTQEMNLLRQLSEGALDSEEARGFLGSIPTVGELVPRVVLREIEQQMDGKP
jgi:multidrug efflux pump subunit AcrA (membrane-fusion protein)